jgi:uncharacterized protein
MSHQIQNAVVLITGASSGIGAEFARQFFGRKASKLVLVARREEKLSLLCDELNSLRDGSAEYIVADLSKSEGIQTIISYLQNNRVDILVNNCGRGSFGMYENLSLHEELSMIALNIGSYVSLTHEFMNHAKKRRSGGIIFISSLAAFQPLPYMATYGATKSFNFNFGIAIKNELKRYNISVTTICPGPVDTEFAGVARVPGGWTGIDRDPVQEVVREGIDAFLKDRSFVVPGIKSKVLYFCIKFLPVCVSSFITEWILKDTLKKISHQVE